MQDVVTKHDRSIRNIPVPPNRKTPPTLRVMRGGGGDVSEKRGFRASALWILVGTILAALLGLIVASLFEGAKVTVYPKIEAVTIDTELKAAADAPVGQLPYQVMRSERNVSRSVPATGEAKVERRASGIVTIYNEFGTQSQRLIKNTRFEAPDGKIYRINDSILVPGGTKRADGSVAAGTIDVTVYADSPGEGYNKEPTQFTIPGFKGDPRYAKFYAKSKTALSGGFVGVERVVAEADLKKAVGEMRIELGALLSEGITSELPEGYLLVSGAIRFSFREPERTNAGSDVSLSIRGEAAAPIVKERDLASTVARLTTNGYQGEAVLFEDRTSVAISLAGGVETLENDPVTFEVSGNPRLIWQFDAEALRATLAGKTKASFDEVVREYQPEIERANASIRPFFRAEFPQDPAEIDVVIGE